MLIQRPSRLASRLAPLGAMLLAGACGGTPDADLADEATATEASALGAGTGVPELENLESVPPGAAAAAVASAPDREQCRTRTLDRTLPNVVHVRLDNCTGRLGRHSVSGEMVVTFSANPDGTLHADHRSAGLTIDGRPATREASTDITFDGTHRRVASHTESTSTNDRGDRVTHAGDHLIDIDRATRCRVASGTGLTHRGTSEVRSAIEALTTCESETGVDYCPKGTIEHENVSKGRHVTKRFDGTATVSVEMSGKKRDRSRQVQIDCTPSPG
jgi:hypothetical protein